MPNWKDFGLLRWCERRQALSVPSGLGVLLQALLLCEWRPPCPRVQRRCLVPNALGQRRTPQTPVDTWNVMPPDSTWFFVLQTLAIDNHNGSRTGYELPFLSRKQAKAARMAIQHQSRRCIEPAGYSGGCFVTVAGQMRCEQSHTVAAALFCRGSR